MLDQIARIIALGRSGAVPDRVTAAKVLEALAGEREAIARALYEHWVAEDFSNEYLSWDLLPGKDTWLDRAVAVIGALGCPNPESLTRSPSSIASSADAP
jgi:hypothetical protein